MASHCLFLLNFYGFLSLKFQGHVHDKCIYHILNRTKYSSLATSCRGNFNAIMWQCLFKQRLVTLYLQYYVLEISRTSHYLFLLNSLKFSISLASCPGNFKDMFMIKCVYHVLNRSKYSSLPTSCHGNFNAIM